jgi:hypothetical protein
LLLAAPGVRAVAIFEEICHRDPEVVTGVRRTWSGRIGKWRALYGPSPDVIFRHEHQGCSPSIGGLRQSSIVA